MSVLRFSSTDIEEILMNIYVHRVSLAVAASEILSRDVTQEEWAQLDTDIGSRWDGWVSARRRGRPKWILGTISPR